jgi:Family of unknown function (DUF5947)
MSASPNSARWVRGLRRFIDPPPQICEHCRAPIPETHEHLIALPGRRLVCVCAPCAATAPQAGSRRFRRIVPQCVKLADFFISDELWLAFDIPVEMAFFIRDERSGDPIALYPGPAGLVQSESPLDAWNELTGQYPWLAQLAPETEALLVNRTNRMRDYYRLSTDYCFGLSGLMRKEWRGFGGGPEFRDRLEAWFTGLSAGAEQAHA